MLTSIGDQCGSSMVYKVINRNGLLLRLMSIETPASTGMVMFGPSNHNAMPGNAGIKVNPRGGN